ncbi:hypothetical protein CERSUDRAFT_60983, partial [Gelatoporia subvermispora B]
DTYDLQCNVVSNAPSTVNCFVSLVKVIHDKFGILEGGQGLTRYLCRQQQQHPFGWCH